MKRTAEHIIKELEATAAMMKPRMTSDAKIKGLEAFQAALLRTIFNGHHAEYLTLRDGVAHLREQAKEKGLENSEVVCENIRNLEWIGKEIAFARSGSYGERAVSRSLRYTNRRITALSNIIIGDGMDRTELDQVVVTSNGVLILEVKNYRNDIVIAESGQVYGNNHRRCSNKSLGERMNLKRYLLRKRVEKELEEMDIPLVLDSYVVFSDPSITVTDHYGLEKYCFNANLPGIIEQFTSDVEYSDHEMSVITDVIQSIAEEEQEFDVGIDFDCVIKTFAEALVLLETEPSPQNENPGKNTGDLNVGENDSRLKLQSQMEEANCNLRKYKTVAMVSTITLAGVLGIGIAYKLMDKN